MKIKCPRDNADELNESHLPLSRFHAPIGCQANWDSVSKGQRTLIGGTIIDNGPTFDRGIILTIVLRIEATLTNCCRLKLYSKFDGLESLLMWTE